MAAPHVTSSAVSLTFDGNPVDLERILAHVSVVFLRDPSAYPTDESKSARLAEHFRGAALDWLSVKLQTQPSPLTNFTEFQGLVRTAFGFDLPRRQQMARTNLGVLKQEGDLLLFLAEFEGLTQIVGSVSDASRLALIMPKLSPYFRDCIVNSGEPIGSYATMVARLKNIYTMRPATAVGAEVRRKKARCGKCGKKGHSASQCPGN